MPPTYVAIFSPHSSRLLLHLQKLSRYKYKGLTQGNNDNRTFKDTCMRIEQSATLLYLNEEAEYKIQLIFSFISSPLSVSQLKNKRARYYYVKQFLNGRALNLEISYSTIHNSGPSTCYVRRACNFIY